MTAEAAGIKGARAGVGSELHRRASSFRFRELTLLPAIALAIVAGALISDAFPAGLPGSDDGNDT